MSTPNWDKLDRDRLSSAQNEYDSQVTYDDLPTVTEWDCWNTTFCVGEIVLYRGVKHTVVNAGPEQGKRLAAVE